MDIYDDGGKNVGTATRYEAHKMGLWHYNFHCWVVTRRGDGALIFQIRSESKPSFPGLLDSTVGGHYKAGERSAHVIREVEEELGIKPEANKLTPLGRRIDVASYGGISKREIAEVFFLESDVKLSRYHVDPTEVAGLLEIPLELGLSLFSGQTNTISAKGIRWNESAKEPRGVAVVLDQERFVPKMDSYYMSLFIAARRYLSGEKHLSI